MPIEHAIRFIRSLASLPDLLPGTSNTPVAPPVFEHGPACTCALIPAIRRSVSRFGHKDTIVSLVSLTVEEAFLWRQPGRVARLLEHNATYLRGLETREGRCFRPESGIRRSGI